jgi:positive regulator of sigma E activity
MSAEGVQQAAEGVQQACVRGQLTSAVGTCHSKNPCPTMRLHVLVWVAMFYFKFLKTPCWNPAATGTVCY